MSCTKKKPVNRSRIYVNSDSVVANMSELADRARKKRKINQRVGHIDDVETFGRKLLEKFGLKSDKAASPPEPHNMHSYNYDSEGVGEERMQPETTKQKNVKKIKFASWKGIGEARDLDLMQLPKKKKKSPRPPIEEINAVEDLRTEDVCRKSEKKNKKRKHAETFVSYVEDEAEQRERRDDEIDDITTKKKKKRAVVDEPKRRTNVETKNKKKTGPDSLGLSNVAFDPSTRESLTNGTVKFEDEVENPYEVKPKKNKKHSFAIDNPTFDGVDENATDITGEGFEVKRKKKKSKKDKDKRGLDNPALNGESGDRNESVTSYMCMPNVDLMLNVATLPVSAPKVNSEVKKRVRFSDVNESFVIPTCYDDNFSSEEVSNRNELFDINEAVIAKSSHDKNTGFVNNAFDIASKKVGFYDGGLETKARRNIGVDNVAFAATQCKLDENIESISNTIDKYHAEVENDMNEAKTNRRLRNDEVAVASNVYKQAYEEELLLEQMRNDSKSEDPTLNTNRRLYDHINGNSFLNQPNVNMKNRRFTIDANDEMPRSTNQMQPRSFSNEDVTRSNTNTFTKRQYDETTRRYRWERTQAKEISVDAATQREVMVGEVGTPVENHESVDDGTKLSYKLAAFHPTPPWSRKEGNYAKKSYKHLIRGDVILKFKNTNLHEIKGYADRKRKAPGDFV